MTKFLKGQKYLFFSEWYLILKVKYLIMLIEENKWFSEIVVEAKKLKKFWKN